MSNMAAISASICTGGDTHPDPAQRWKAGVIYGFLWLVIAGCTGLLIALSGAAEGADRRGRRPGPRRLAHRRARTGHVLG
jgi:hypothetical protein